MKKFFTFLFSMSLAAFTFAQSGYRHQDQNSENNYQPIQNSRNSQANDNGYSRSNSYSRDQQYDGQRNNDEGYGYGNADRDRNDRFRDDHDRYDRGREWRERNHGRRDDHYARQYTPVRVERDYYPQQGFPLLQIILGIGGR